MKQTDDYPEREYSTKSLPENIRLIGGTLGWSIFLWMFYHPFDGYTFPMNRLPKSGHWYPLAFVRFLELGIIAMNATDTGYTLTAQGRLWVADELAFIAEIERIKSNPRYIEFDYDNDEYRDGRNPDDQEWMYRVRDTY